jgi:Family of unknown function (DUF6291)
MKKSFILHLDSLSILDEMTFEQKGILFDAIYKYQQGEDVNLDFAMKMAFAPFKNQFIRDNEKYNEFKEKQTENGKKGGRPPKDKPNLETQENPNNPSLLDETQKSLNDSVNDSVSENDSKKVSNSKNDLEKEISKEILPRDSEKENLLLEVERLNKALEEKNKKNSTQGGRPEKPKKQSWLDLKEIVLPAPYNDNDFLETWQSWCDFKDFRKETILTEKGFELWFKKLETLSSRDMAISIQIINESIANNWQGIFELKNQKSNAGIKPNNQKQTPVGAVGGVNSQGRGMFLIPLDYTAENSKGNDSCIEVEGFYQTEL